MKRVEQMVCPLCARMLGQSHADGCPETMDAVEHREWARSYREGWIAARDALVPPLCDRIVELEQAVDTAVRRA